MQAEYQSPESRTAAAIEDSYSFIETVSGSSTWTRRREELPSDLFRYRVVKRSLDIFLILLAAPLLFLTLGAVALVVMLSSPGPIFYSHRRIRKNGAFFSMWKFRTMCVNSASFSRYTSPTSTTPMSRPGRTTTRS